MLGSIYSSQVADSVLAVELGGDLVAQTGFALIQTASLDDDDTGHDIQLGVQAGAAGAAEMMAVVLARLSLDVVELGLTWIEEQSRPLAEGSAHPMDRGDVCPTLDNLE